MAPSTSLQRERERVRERVRERELERVREGNREIDIYRERDLFSICK
jgi:hypothetical protein